MRRAVPLLLAGWFALWICGSLYLLPVGVLPEWLMFFTRSACLFPYRATYSIDYFAEGWSCRRRDWEALDTAPYFPTVVSGRETRFERAMRLYLFDGRVKFALRGFLVHGWNEDHPHDEIADVRLLDVRTPVPPLGAEMVRYRRADLATVPRREIKIWDRGASRGARDRRCADLGYGDGAPP